MFRIVMALAVILFSTAVRADDDAEGCKDHPLFNRMPRHHIYTCEHSEFELRRFPVGALDADNKTKLEDVEGEYWKIEFVTDEDAPKASGLLIQRNFQNAIKAAGGSVEGTYPEWCKLELDDTFTQGGNGCTNYGTTLKVSKGGKEYWTFVNATNQYDRGYTLYIVAREAMKQSVSVNELVDKLNKDGFLTLYVNFDTDKSTIKPDSNQTLDDAANALKAAPGMKIEVGGHTDNVGSAEHNLKLSEARAKAVMDALIKRGIAADRLTAKGYGQTSPVADNRSEEGRSKNRRVELVKK